MAISLLHSFVSGVPDSTNTSVARPSNWNAQHNLTGTGNSLLHFAAGGAAADGNLFSPAAGTLAGGTAAGSTLTLESTSGAGSGDFISFKTGSQVEAMRILNDGSLAGKITISVANGANVALPHSAASMLIVSESVQGDHAIYHIAPSGTVNTVALGFGNWVATTTTPSAGKLSVAWDGSSTFRVYNNQGATETITCLALGA